ncbi:DUF4129 domain-containing protein [Hymenobacter aranciens]|nr:DUF4129 domain-containing protein [Hymenobacter sp. ASUV-10]
MPLARAAQTDTLAVSTLAEDREAPTQTLPVDRSTTLPPRRADAERLRELAAQREFQYREAKTELSFWERFWNWLWEWLGKISSTKQGRTTWKYGFYAALAGILVFAVLKLLQVDIGGVFGRKPRRSTLPYDVTGENIHEVDFPTRIAEAEAAGDFRLATRLGYLAILKTLTDQGLINWQPDKTNQTYLHELSNGALRNSFREATRQFEYVWYGELPLTAALYQQVRADQRAVTAPLNGRRPSTLAPTA